MDKIVLSLLINILLGILVIYAIRKVILNTSFVANIGILLLSIVLPLIAVFLLIYYVFKLFFGKKDQSEYEINTIKNESSEGNSNNELK